MGSSAVYFSLPHAIQKMSQQYKGRSKKKITAFWKRFFPTASVFGTWAQHQLLALLHNTPELHARLQLAVTFNL